MDIPTHPFPLMVDPAEYRRREAAVAGRIRAGETIELEAMPQLLGLDPVFFQAAVAVATALKVGQSVIAHPDGRCALLVPAEQPPERPN